MSATTETIKLEEVTEFNANLQKASILWLEAVASMKSELPSDVAIDPFGITNAWIDASINFWREPEKAIAMQAEYFDGINSIWNSYFIGGADRPKVADEVSRRFKHEAWQENAIFSFLRASHNYLRWWSDKTLDQIEDLDDHEKVVARLSARNMVEAFNPANFATANPEVIEATIKEKGANLVRGMEMLRDDIRRGNGELLIRQVDFSAFEVGKNVAITPGQVIYENSHYQIIQYAPKTEKVKKKPILIVPPWINKYYILDLNEKKSYAKWIVEQGYTVFMISWVNADEKSIDLTWDARLQAVEEAIDIVNKECASDQAHLISFCIGGTMTGSLLADLGKREDMRVASSTFLTAQFDFEHAGELMAYVSENSVALIDQYRDVGYVPAQAMSNGFNLLRSNDLIWSYVVNNYMLGKSPMAFDLLYWNSDSMRMPIEIQKFYLDQFYLKNAFMNDCLPIQGHHVGVTDIRVPTYHLAAIEDHIAPAASVFVAAKAMVNAKVRYVLASSGHIAGVVNPPAQKKYQYWRNDQLNYTNLDEWHDQAKAEEGSWWLDWVKWLDEFKDDEVQARSPGQVYKSIEPAPGRYVRVRFDV